MRQAHALIETPENPQAKKAKTKKLDLLLEQLIGIRNTMLFVLLGIAGQSPGTDASVTDELALRTAYLHLVCSFVGVAIMLINLLWSMTSNKWTVRALKKNLEKTFAGKNSYVFLSFLLGISCGFMLRHMALNSDKRDD